MAYKWRQQFDDKRDQEEARLAGITCADESMTQQSFRDECDINVLVKRFGVEKMAIPPQALDPRFFGDFSDVPDLRTALDRMRDAQEHFNALDPRLRARFHNDPAILWEWVNDRENAAEAVSLGLLAEVRPEVKGEAPPPPPG